MDYFVVYTLVRTFEQQDPTKPVTASLPKKNFFWCSSSNFIFSSLPSVKAETAKQLCEMSTLFSGEFDTVLMESNEAPKVIDAAAGIVMPPKNVTELDRLAATVEEINRACFSVPRGSAKFTPLNQVHKNDAFRGLPKDQAFSLDGWVHFREVQNEKQKAMIARGEAVYSDEFLDDVSADLPKFCWSIIKDTTQTVATLRSQLWPGYYGFHRSNTPIYGSVYIGDGIKNIDLPFMI